jgi:hypothetical protein
MLSRAMTSEVRDYLKQLGIATLVENVEILSS